MNSLHEVFSSVLDEYNNCKADGFKGNPLVRKITNEYKDALSSFIHDPWKNVDASAGKGNFADVPWFLVSDKRITKTAQNSIYLVYLFKKDGTGVYLSLNQGWTFFKNSMGSISSARDGIGKASEKMRGFLDKDDSVIPSNRLETKIDLAVDLTDELGLGYERGNVYATYYSADNLPDDDVLKSDLDDYLGMYDRLLKKIGVNEDMGEGDALPLYEDIAKSCAVFDGTFDGACADRTIYQGTGSEDFIGRNNTEYVPDKGLIIESEQEGVDLVADEKITSQSIDAVVKYEKRLLSNGITNHLANRVVRSSTGSGYDVQSFESEDGFDESPCYIVVKATRGPIGTPIKMTKAEFDLSARHPNEFKLYRVYGITEASAEGYYLLDGDVRRYMK